MIMGKDIRKTTKGNTCIIYQDSPTMFHMSVSIGTATIYDCIDSPESLDIIYQHAETLESELEGTLQEVSNTE